MPIEKDDTSSEGDHHKIKDETLNSRWTPVIYQFKWGKSATRGCLFAWIFLALPTIAFHILSHKAARGTFRLFGNPEYGTFRYLIVFWISWIPQIIIGIIWVLVIIILFIPWLICYVIGFIVEVIMMLFYGVTCGHCSSHSDQPKAMWRSFTCSGWATEWQTGFDPFTKHIWDDWSPVRTMCDYNCPMV